MELCQSYSANVFLGNFDFSIKNLHEKKPYKKWQKIFM